MRYLIGIIFYSGVVFSGQIQFVSEPKQTEFLAIGKPAMIKIAGYGDGPEGILISDKKIITGILKVNMNSLTTQMELRDDHMKNKYLEVAKYPYAELKITELNLPFELEKMTDELKETSFKGELKIKNKSQPLDGTFTLKRTGQNLTGKAEFNIKVMSYLESLPSHMGVKVAEDVKMKISFKAILK